MVNCNMIQNDGDEVVDGPVVSEGGRSPSTLSPGQSAPATRGGAALGPLAPNQRWSGARKREVVLRLMRGEAAELLSRELGLPLFKLEQWRQKAEAALEGALKEREADPAEGQLAAAMQRIGELSMEVELLRAKMERPGPCMGLPKSSAISHHVPSFVRLRRPFLRPGLRRPDRRRAGPVQGLPSRPRCAEAGALGQAQDPPEP